MSSLERKLKRKQDKKAKELEDKLAKKLNMFDELPEGCLTCEKKFDRKNKEMVTSWYVVQSTDNVRLYCPPCWEGAQKLVKEYMENKSE